MSEQEEVTQNVSNPEPEDCEDAEMISAIDLATISNAKMRVQLCVAQAEKVAADARIADLEYRSLVQHIFIKYGLKIADKIDDSTGHITRVKDNS